MSWRLAFHVITDAHAGENHAASLLNPQGAHLHRQWAAQLQKPITKNAQNQSPSQRHSAPQSVKTHCVSGARKRLRAECESNFRSSSVRKSMVPNSRSQAGGPLMVRPVPNKFSAAWVACIASARSGLAGWALAV